MAQVLGGTVSGRQASETAGSCTWLGPIYKRPLEESVQPTLTVTVYRQTEAQFWFEARLNEVPVRGIGVPASYKAGGVEYLRVWRDGYTLTFMPLSADPSLARLERLARLAVHHLS